MQRVLGFLPIYNRLKNRRSVVTKTKKYNRAKPISPHSISMFIISLCQFANLCFLILVEENDHEYLKLPYVQIDGFYFLSN